MQRVPFADPPQPSDSEPAEPRNTESAPRRGNEVDAHQRDTQAQKRALRAELRARRSSAPAVGSESARQAGERLWAQLVDSVDWSQVGCAALYASVGHELDTEPLQRQLSRRGVRTCYPRIVCERPPELAFHVVADPAELAPARYGLREPLATATAVLPTEIDVFIVPGLAFDTAGRRLGQGRGYYDACLQSQPDALRVGVCHPWQHISAVPCEPHDERMDLLATPLACLATGSRTRHRLQRLSSPLASRDTTVAGTVRQPTESKL